MRIPVVTTADTPLGDTLPPPEELAALVEILREEGEEVPAEWLELLAEWRFNNDIPDPGSGDPGTLHLQGQQEYRGRTPVAVDEAVAGLLAGQPVVVHPTDAAAVVADLVRFDGTVNDPVDLTNLDIVGYPMLVEAGRHGLRRREDMPHIPKQIGNFQAHLRRAGIHVTPEAVDPTTIHATQNELNGVTVGQMLARLQGGTYATGDAPWVSSDDYILDGHHRWAMFVVAQAAGLEPPPFDVARVGMPIADLLTVADEFNRVHDIEGRTLAMSALLTHLGYSTFHQQGQHDQRSHGNRGIDVSALADELGVPACASDGDCIDVSDRVAAAIPGAEVVSVIGWVDEDAKVLGFLHQAVQVGGDVIDLTATQFDPDLPRDWMTSTAEYERILAERTGVSKVTVRRRSEGLFHLQGTADDHDQKSHGNRGGGRSVTAEFAEPPAGYRPEYAEEWRAGYAYLRDNDMPDWWNGTEYMDDDGLPKRDNGVAHDWSREGISDELEAFKAEVGEQVAGGIWSIGRDAEARRRHAIQEAISMNEISVDDAVERWGKYHSEAGGNSSRPWEELPAELYHATSSLSAIADSGTLKSRRDIGGQKAAAGLGGGDDATISFTSDRAVADGIARSLHEVHRAVNMSNDDLVATLRERAGDWWPEVQAAAKSIHGRDVPETVEDRYNLYRTFTAYRERKEGILDPMFFNVDSARLAAMDPAEIGVVTVRPAVEGAKGYQVSALGEWRIPTGRAVEITSTDQRDDIGGFSAATFHLQGTLFDHDQQTHAGGTPSKLAGVELDSLVDEVPEGVTPADVAARFELDDGSHEYKTADGGRLYRAPDGRYVTLLDDDGVWVNLYDSLYDVEDQLDLVDLEDQIDAEWRDGIAAGPVYHGTDTVNWDSIRGDGLQQSRKTRGINNRWVGSAVFATTDRELAAQYGPVITVDLPAAIADGVVDMDALDREPGFTHADALSSVASSFEDYDFDPYSQFVGSGEDPQTVIIHADIPVRYLSFDDDSDFHLQGQHDQQTHGRRYGRTKALSDPDGGFTLDALQLEPYNEGYAVALAGTDRLLLAADAFGPDGEPSPELVRLTRDRIDAARQAAGPAGTQMALGGWHNPDDGKVEVNVTVVFPPGERDRAAKYAADNDQIAMADLAAIARGDWDDAIIQTGGTGGNRDT